QRAPWTEKLYSCRCPSRSTHERPKGQAPDRVQRLGVRRLARRLLPAEDPEVGLSEALFERLQRGRGGLLVLPHPGPRDDEAVVQDDPGRFHLRDEDAEADHAREEAERRGGEPRLVLCVREGAEGEVRAPRRPAP